MIKGRTGRNGAGVEESRRKSVEKGARRRKRGSRSPC